MRLRAVTECCKKTGRRRTKKIDIRFKLPSTFLLAGPSYSGKTTWCFNLLRAGKLLFQEPDCLKNVYWFYNHPNDDLKRFKQEGIVRKFINSMPSSQEIMELARPHSGKNGPGSVFIIDDFVQKVTQDSAQIFRGVAHHGE